MKFNLYIGETAVEQIDVVNSPDALATLKSRDYGDRLGDPSVGIVAEDGGELFRFDGLRSFIGGDYGVRYVKFFPSVTWKRIIEQAADDLGVEYEEMDHIHVVYPDSDTVNHAKLNHADFSVDFDSRNRFTMLADLPCCKSISIDLEHE